MANTRIKVINTLRNLLVGISLFILALGCTAIEPVTLEDETLEAPSIFSHGDFERVLQGFVDDKGLVDYGALKNNPLDLERYYLLLSTYSPDSHPTLFPSKQANLAYWINAYNAAAIKIVLTYYPISSVRDIKPPTILFFLPEKTGFFVFQRVSFGGKTTNLYYLENGVIRKRFSDPRVHFALNCAALGCPRMPRRVFTSQGLNEQLDREARDFLAEERNLRVDHQEKTIYMSSIFKWYKNDFLNWYRESFPQQEATLLNYVSLYLPGGKSDEIRGLAASYRVRFIPYDWRLNDRNPP
ncbi:MAG: DUF547 domain-containing protein, partial [Desulfatiglandales bacterium]